MFHQEVLLIFHITATGRNDAVTIMQSVDGFESALIVACSYRRQGYPDVSIRDRDGEVSFSCD
jgi:hypothetical protein